SVQSGCSARRTASIIRLAEHHNPLAMASRSAGVFARRTFAIASSIISTLSGLRLMRSSNPGLRTGSKGGSQCTSPGREGTRIEAGWRRDTADPTGRARPSGPSRSCSASGAASQRVAGELLEDGDRGLFGEDKARPPDNEGLLEHVLAAEA